MLNFDYNDKSLSEQEYQAFLARKNKRQLTVGIDIDPSLISSVLFPFQRDIVRWALKRGRCAIFADTGLGKTLMQVEWARLIAKRSLIIAPLSVARQTVREARDKLGVEVRYTRSGDDLIDGINITNYEMFDHFDPSDFDAVVLDESSILKNLDGVFRHKLTDAFAATPYRLCATATPAPNDITEIGRHAEFLGVMTNAEMLAAYFINDMKQKDGTYRLKRHAVQKFYEWLASWGMAVKKPSDIGYEDNGYILPPLNVKITAIDSDYNPNGMLPGFWGGNLSAIEARRVRKETIEDRAKTAAKMVNESDEQWVIWAGLNAEGELLEQLIPDSVNVYGSMSPETKADRIEDFTTGSLRVLVTKASIAGFGINMQVCNNMIFCGIDYSWESYYQAVRRCYRFGQKREVNVHIVISEQEQTVFQTILNKEQEAIKMTDELIANVSTYEQAELHNSQIEEYEYMTDDTTGNGWKMMLGDSTERIKEIDDNSIDLTIFSPPFRSLYVYTPTERDLGNSNTPKEFFDHFAFIIKDLLRITKPGRNCCVHVQQIATTKANDGVIGINDFRGDVIRAYQSLGWIFHGEVTIDKNPQVQAIRTKTKGLMFAQLHKDSVANRPAFGDYLLIFQKPGDNEVPVIPDVTNEEWIEWAHPVWYDISETDVLNVAVARSEKDERHMCPLQLPLIARCIRLWSNPGETVFSPFAGIGSELHEAVRLDRKAIGIELKPEYWRVAQRNLRNAEVKASQKKLL